MKKTLLFGCILTALLYTPKAHASNAFPILDWLITPLPISDIVSTPVLGGMTAQQIIAALVAVIDFGNREALQETMSKDGPGLTDRPVEKTNPPEIEAIQSASDTDISILKEGGADIKNPRKTAEVVEKELMISEETSSLGVQKERAKRNKFAQENAISAMANALYFDTKLEELQKTVEELSQTNAEEDKYGAVNANYRYLSTWYKLLTLLEQIKAERLQLKGAQGVMEAMPVKNSIVGQS